MFGSVALDCGVGGCCARAICIGTPAPNADAAASVVPPSRILRRLSASSLSRRLFGRPSIRSARSERRHYQVTSNRIFSIEPVNGNEPFAL